MANVSPRISPPAESVLLPDFQRQRQWQNPTQQVVPEVMQDQQKPFEEHANTDPDGNARRKKKKKKKGRKKSRQVASSEIGGLTPEIVAAVDKLAAELASQHEGFMREMESQHEGFLREMESQHQELMREMDSQHEGHMKDIASLREELNEETAAIDKGISALKVQFAMIDEKLQDIHDRYREFREALTQGDRRRVCRRMLLDAGRETVQEDVYGMPKGCRWIPFSKRFTSREAFVAETLPLCQDKGLDLSEDTLKERWEASPSDARGLVAHDRDAKNADLELAITTLPAGSKDRDVLTQIFVCEFGHPPSL